MPTPDNERPVEVDREPRRHRRDRGKAVWLPRAGCFVVRFLAEEIEGRLERVVNQLALGAGARRASGSSVEDPR